MSAYGRKQPLGPSLNESQYQRLLLAGDDLPVAGWTIRAQTLPQLRQVWEETKSNRSPDFIQFVEENVFNR